MEVGEADVTIEVAVAAVVTGRNNDRPAEERNVAAVNTTDIVEYDASTSIISTQSTSTNSDRGGRSGGRFGPSRTE
jgi:hypothetical protein